MDSKHILVTGGAGYIGSHVVRQLGEAGERIVVLDDLSTGFKQAVTYGDLIVGNTGDLICLRDIFSRFQIDTVMHFAAHTIVPESVAEPLKYYRNNTCASRTLLEAALDAGVEHVVFSSTAAVYGNPQSVPVREDAPTPPISPYGSSKLMSEIMLHDAGKAYGLRFVVLRYFNVAGADPKQRTGQSTPQATHLIKVACETALGKREKIEVFGTDYPTPDGTCIRDYIHVSDLAAAHSAALTYLRDGGQSATFNCGYGRGASVLEVIEAVKKASGVDFPVELRGRRPGDPASLVADVSRIRSTLAWRPRYDDLDTIVAHALAWEELLGKRRSAAA